MNSNLSREFHFDNRNVANRGCGNRFSFQVSVVVVEFVRVGLWGTRLQLMISELERLQNESDAERVSLVKVLWKVAHDDMYSDFEKHVLATQPNDCSIVQKYSRIESFPIKGRNHLEEVNVSTFYSDHPLREFHKRSVQANVDVARAQLAKIEEIPVIVFLHGLGGQISQFEPILQELRNCADMFGIDLPGFGNSKRPSREDISKGLKFMRLSEYSEGELFKVEKTLANMKDEDFHTDAIVDMMFQILEHKFHGRKLILIAHSMGTHIGIKLIDKFEAGKIEAFIMMAPPRMRDRPETDIVLRLEWRKKLALTASWYIPRLFDVLRYFDRRGALHSHSVNKYIHFEKGEDDLLKRLRQLRWNLDTESNIFLKYLFGFECVSRSDISDMISKTSKVMICCGEYDTVTPIRESENMFQVIKNYGGDVKFEIIPQANHSLFLDKPNLLAGSIYQFIEGLGLNISCTWVLQVKALLSGDKWGLKNEAKWNSVKTISDEIKAPNGKSRSFLLGMKTLRETDKIHNPIKFENDHPEVYAIIDIGSDTPSYEPKNFKRIKYIKYKTESKVTPDNVTIMKFNKLVGELIKEREDEEQFIAVHCHYGQNRTGFLICCYLIEKLGWSVSEAIEGFEVAKPPGIKHVHFKNALYLRYQE